MVFASPILDLNFGTLRTVPAKDSSIGVIVEMNGIEMMVKRNSAIRMGAMLDGRTWKTSGSQKMFRTTFGKLSGSVELGFK